MSPAEPLKMGDKVTYADVNLFGYRGTLVSLGPTPLGGDCHVRWERGYQGVTEECLANLQQEK